MADDLPNPHDRYFRETFSDPDVARDFLRHYLPATVVHHLNLSSLTLMDGSFVDGALRDHASDMLYRLDLADGGEAFVYLLVEHKSYPDRQVAFQLLRYVVRVWERFSQEDGRLRPVFPIVLYHGEAPWHVPEDVIDLVEAPAELRDYLPSMRHYLCDLSSYSAEEIVGGVHARLALRLLQMIFAPDLGAQLPQILGLAMELTEPKTALQWLETALRYVTAASPYLEPEEVQNAIDAVFSDNRSDIMPTLAERWIEQGKRQGLEQGLEQGREQGRLQMVAAAIALLEARFGALQPELIDALRQLSLTKLQQVTVAILDFDDPDDVGRFIERLQQST